MKEIIRIKSLDEALALPSMSRAKALKYLIQFTCEVCSKEASITYRSFRDRKETSLICSKCLVSKNGKGKHNKTAEEIKLWQEKVKKTLLEKYGVESYFSSKEFLHKKELTEKEKYGDLHQRLESNKKKVKQTKLEKYGDENFNNIEKNKQTCLEKYGFENVFQVPEIKEKCKQTLILHLGVDHASKSDEVLKKREKTYLERYGVVCPFNNEAVKEKAKQAIIEKYGLNFWSEHSRKIWANKSEDEKKDIREKAKQTCLERYGSVSWATSEFGYIPSRKKYMYQGITFDSSWELAFYVYCKNLGLDIIREPTSFEYICNGSLHKYFPDFLVEGCFVEIKGDQFFNEKNEPWDPYRKSFWWEKYNLMKSLNVNIIKGEDILKYLIYVNDIYGEDFLKNCRLNNGT